MVPDETKKSAPAGANLVSSFQVLHVVNDALKLIEQGEDASDVRRAILTVQERFEKCEGILDRLPGGALTRADQEAEIRRLREELERKRALVAHFSAKDIISRVLAQRAIPAQDADGMDPEDNVPPEMDDVDMIKMDPDGFADEPMEKVDEADDMLMGLGI